MHSSYDEIRRISFRALDAGGAAAGIDEDSAHAVAWLEAVGLPGLATLADALDASDPSSRSSGLEISPTVSPAKVINAGGQSAVFHAASVVDLLIADAQSSNTSAAALTLHGCMHPLMLAASAARFCPRGATISATWRGVEFTIKRGKALMAENGPDATEWLDPSAFDVSLSCSFAPPAEQTQAGANLTDRLENALRSGLDVDGEAHVRISDYAVKILVPETEASRLGGAGAGLTDND